MMRGRGSEQKRSENFSRRQFAYLTFLVAAMLFVLVIIQSATVSASPATGNDNWAMFRGDLQHNGSIAANGPTENVSLLWKFETGSPIWSSPAVAEGRVYVGCRDGNIYCFNASTGDRVWSYQTLFLPFYSSPAIANGHVLIGLEDNYLYSIDAYTAIPFWRCHFDGAVRSSPLVADGRVYVGSWDDSLHCLNETTGDILWSCPTLNEVDSSPALANGVVYVASEDNHVYAVDAYTGLQVWNYSTGAPTKSSPSIYGGRVYVGSDSGYVYGLNATSDHLVWQYQTPDSVVSSPAATDGRVYVGSEDNNMYCLNASSGEKIWSYSTGYWVWSSPVVAGGSVYVGSEDHNIYCLNVDTGQVQWVYPTGSAVDSSPAIAYGNLYVGSDDGSVYALTSSPNAATPSQPANPSEQNVFVFDVAALMALVAVSLVLISQIRSAILSNSQKRASSSGLRAWVSNHQETLCVVLILVFSTTFFLSLSNRPLWVADEQTYTQWAYHMLKAGDYLHPWAFGDTAIWIGKPPLDMWLMSLAYQVFGVNNFGARFWSAVFGLMSCVVLFYLGKALYNRYIGLLAALGVGAFSTFFIFATHAMTDMPLVFFMVASIYFLLSSGKPRNSNWFAALSGLFFGLALLTKLTDALLIVLVLSVYFIIASRRATFALFKRLALFLGVAFLVFVPWLILMDKSYNAVFWE